jgi:Flp pilus assembly protein TadG
MMTRAFLLHRLARRFTRDRRGVAGIEFGIIAPVMITLYFGLVELTQGVMIHRKVTQLSRALADLTSQVTSISDAEAGNIFNAVQTVMMPFTSVTPDMSIASVVINNDGIARICWVEQRGSSIGDAGSVIDVPAALRVPNTSLIVAQASYSFSPQIPYPLTGPIAIGGNRVYMRPRLGKVGGSSGVEQVERVKPSARTMC